MPAKVLALCSCFFVLCAGDNNQKCGKNEYLADCANACDPVECPESYADEQANKADCVATAVCLPVSCRCLPGYRRDHNMKCIDIADCPGICPKNEEFSNCTKSSDRPQNCPGVANSAGPCKPGCVCKKHMLRDQKGNCVPKDQCPDQKCGKNEYLATCASACDPVGCPESYADEQAEKANCVAPAVCLPASCRCLPGYRRDRNMKCIDIADCPGICPKNEKFSNCTKSSDRPQNCPGLANSAGPCKPGCVCKKHMLRDQNGNCVPKDQCPAPQKQCGQNEVLSCVNDCRPEGTTCQTRGVQYRCPQATTKCKEKCICKPGYYTNTIGECISEKECDDLVCEDNEVVNTCTNSTISDDCPKNEEEAQLSDTFPEPCSNDTCVCQFNYRRAENGTCIPTRDCPPFECSGINEEYNPCPPLCPSDDCSQATPSGKCPFGNIGIVLPCRPSCRCIAGYWRYNGVCVPYDECPGKCPANEEFSTCAQAVCRAQNCSQRGQPIPCPAVAEGSCEGGCVCVNGTYRNASNICVPEDQCPVSAPQPPCGQNQILSCVTECLPEGPTCTMRSSRSRCRESKKKCEEKCVCKPGYYKNAIGECITGKECDRCNGTNEFFSCGPACDNVCSELATQNRTNCPIQNIMCNRMCYCEDGYARNSTNQCVPVEECPAPAECPANEEFSTCVQAVCRPQNCSQIGESMSNITVAEGSCEEGCVCVNGTYRNASNICVPEDQCPAAECPANEEFSTCVQAVNRPQNCSQIGECMSYPTVAEESCEEGCVCVNGTYRNASNICVPEDQCPAAECPANEEFSTCVQAVNRPQNCSQIGECMSYPTVAEESCEEGCVCVNGTYRNASNICVPEDQCPAAECPANEEYSTCVQAVNRPQNCSQIGECMSYTTVAEGSCEEGCVCVNGTYRNASNICVPEDQCPAAECPANEEYSTCVQAVNRPQNCSQIGECMSYTTVAEGSCEEGCVCVNGTYRNASNICVPEDQCPAAECPANEEYSTCVQAVNRPQNCSQIGECMSYTTVAEGSCEEGCVCVNGTYRNASNICVPEDQCPAAECPANEEFSTCVQAVCRPQNCSQIGACMSYTTVAEGSCEEGCVCVNGTYRNASNICVPEDQCPAAECPANEEFSTCVQAVCRPQNCSQIGQSMSNITVAEGSCEEGCVCVNGTYRNASNICVPENQCPAAECPANEEFSTCVQAVCRPQNCSQIGESMSNITVAEGSCEEGCVCVNGTYRNASNICVPENQCPAAECPANEEFSTCVQAVCRPQNCSQIGESMSNITVAEGSCEEGCVCVNGTYRNASNICVPEDQCPATCGENEEYYECKQTCPKDLCMQLTSKYKCPDNPPCISGCACSPGYLRKTEGSPCVPICDCPQMKNSPDCMKTPDCT